MYKIDKQVIDKQKKQTNNKQQQIHYSTSQYLVITSNGKESEKEYIIYIIEYIIHDHIAVYLKLTQHCMSTVLQLKHSFKVSQLQTPLGKMFSLRNELGF